MVETIKGIVLRETPVGEYDKIMTVLTAEHGKISICANGAKRLKSPLFAATQLFAYGEFTISRTKTLYYLKTAELVDSFYHIRDTLEGTALAGYIADVAMDIAIEDEPSEGLMRLLLNCFHVIAGQKKPLALVKGVFELRAATMAGFMPDLVACSGCGKSDLSVCYFDVTNGTLRCEECYHAASALMEAMEKRRDEHEGIYPEGQSVSVVSGSVFAGMRYAVYSRPERMFSFELKDEALSDFSRIAEKYILCHLDHYYSTLEFYHSVK